MITRSLRRAAAVRGDLLDIWRYVSQAGEQAADRALDQIEATEVRLLEFPELGSRREGFADDVRVMPTGRYLIVYRASADVIEILRVIDGRRQLDTETLKTS